MPKGLKRYYGCGNLHFVTFSCYQRLPLLGTAYARSLFLEALAPIRARYDFLLVGYVVMPEHVHLLIGESAKGNPSVVLRVLKQRVSRDLRNTKNIEIAEQKDLSPRGNRVLPCFWQDRFYDFNVYSAKKKKEKLEYMHGNPVKRGLVGHPSEWVWSSYSFYSGEGTGLVGIDPV
jgi:putative transposase